MNLDKNDIERIIERSVIDNLKLVLDDRVYLSRPRPYNVPNTASNKRIIQLMYKNQVISSIAI